MLKKILMPTMIGAAIAMTGPAFAESMKDTQSNVYKESQSKANAAVKDKKVSPDAKLNKNLYKNAQPGTGKEVMDKKVEPNAEMNKRLYKESQKSAIPSETKK